MRRIVMVTDCVDVAFSEMCGNMHKEAALLGENIYIEPLVPVINFSEINANFLTRVVAENYPAGTIIYTLVSKSNNIKHSHDVLWGETKTGHFFIGSNFGYFGWLAQDLGVRRVYKIENIPQSNFSAKTHIAPLVARLACSDETSISNYVCSEEIIDKIDFPVGTVLHIDNFGNVKLALDIRNQTSDLGDSAIYVNEKHICQASHISSQVYLENNSGKIVFYVSTSFDHLTDVAMVRGSFADTYKIKIGDIVRINPIGK